MSFVQFHNMVVKTVTLVSVIVLFVACMPAGILKADACYERSFVIVTASYNNKDWYRNNLDSIFSQDYTNYKLIYCDDCSSDGTTQLVEDYIAMKGQQARVVLVKNERRVLAMENLYRAIHMCDDKDIIIILDGDDWFPHAGVLRYLNAVYADPNIWITYGQYQEYPSGAIGFNKPIPREIVRNNAFREHYNAYSHLRTFYAGLFKKIKAEDLMHEGAFVPMSYDVAMMMPMMEMARDHFTFIPDVLCVYNSVNVINDHKVSKMMQRSMDLIIRGRQRYERIHSPF